MSLSLWLQCIARLEDELPTTEFSMWIRPLQAELSDNTLALYAPNQFVLDWVQDKYLNNINGLLNYFCGTSAPLLCFKVGSTTTSRQSRSCWEVPLQSELSFCSNVNQKYNFDNFVEGKSNQLARAAALQVADNPGGCYNPLFIYGGTGLGKTHLLYAIRKYINKINYKIIYTYAKYFINDIVKALQNNAMDKIHHYYRSVDVLLIDDIQYFANKKRSQEELFHIFNSLLAGNQQIIFTSNHSPKEINGIDERLKSRFGWGLTIEIEPPDIKTRVAILIQKADEKAIHLPDDVAFFIAKRLRSNVRELEGALNRVIAHANFTSQVINIDFVHEALRDLLTLQDKLITTANIQKTVAEYYKIKVTDLLSKSRSRSVARPRQVAMTLSKQLTSHSLPEIGDAFGGRDHTTVLHACRKIEQLCKDNHNFKEDLSNLIRTLSS